MIFQALEDDVRLPSAEDTDDVSAKSGHEDVREWRDLAGIEVGAAGIAASTDGRSDREPS